MGIADVLAKEIKQEIDILQEGEFGEVLPEQIVPAVPIEEYLDPEPDVLEGGGYGSLESGKILGCYVPMSSPGTVCLSRRNIRGFFWSLVNEVQGRIRYITKGDLMAGLQLVILKTYNHELFHFYCDVLRNSFGGSHNALSEEALAVAWARMKLIQESQRMQTQLGRMNAAVFKLMMLNAFRYASPGYRDWPLYSDDASFKSGIISYLPPRNHITLMNNGVDLGGMMYGLLGSISGGYVEKII